MKKSKEELELEEAENERAKQIVEECNRSLDYLVGNGRWLCYSHNEFFCSPHNDIQIAIWSGMESMHSVYADCNESTLSTKLCSHLLPLLDECAEARAVIYHRDYRRLVWYVFDPEYYRTCCEKYEFSETDFMIWNKVDPCY